MALWVGIAIILVALICFYAWWTARRLDRLHTRLDSAAIALDGQLVRRAEAAAVAAGMLLVDETPAVGRGDELQTDVTRLADTARAALVCRGRLDRDRETVENALSTAATEVAEPRVGRVDATSGEALSALIDQATRAAFARRFYNDAVRDVLVVRDRRVVRWLHLAGRAPLPSYLEMDDGSLPSLPPLTGSSLTAAEN